MAFLLSVVNWIWAILMMTGVIPHDFVLFPMYGPTLLPGWVFALCMTVCAILLIIRHKENIKRLKEGTERTITWMK